MNNLSEIAQMWADRGGQLTLQNTIFLLVVFAILFLFRNAPAKYLHWLGVLGLFKLVLPPFLPGYFLSPGPISSNVNPVISIGGMMPVEPQSLPTGTISLTTVLFVIWLLAAVGYLGLVLVRTFALKLKLHRTGTRHFEPNVPEPVRLYLTPAISSPLSLGIFSPKIYLPEDWVKLSPECRKMMLAHEITHHRRFDGLTNLLQVVVRAIYLFHPLVWLLERLIDQYREMACDDEAVAAAKLTPLAFSRYLVQYAEQVAFPRLGYVSASALIRRKKQLFNRIHYQMKEVKMLKLNRMKVTGLIVLLLLSMVPFSWYKTVAAPAPVDAPALGKIYGVVTDKETGKPLAGANVVLQGTKMGAATDANGKFFVINVPPGSYTLKFSFIGYKVVVLDNVQVAAKKATQLNAKLEQTIIVAPESGTEELLPPPKPLKPEGGEQLVTSPPPAPDSNWIAVRTDFVPFDQAPEPIGGYAAIARSVKYPEIARKYQLYGIILVKTLINAAGKVEKTEIHTNSKIESGTDANSSEVTQKNFQFAHQTLETNVLKAIQESQWKPAQQRDRTVPVWILVPVKVDLRTEAAK